MPIDNEMNQNQMNEASGPTGVPSLRPNAHIDLVEVQNEIKEGRLKPDGHFLKANGSTLVHKAAVEPAWHLPSLAKRLGATNAELRKHLFRT